MTASKASPSSSAAPELGSYRRQTMLADGIAGGALLLMALTWPLCNAADDSAAASGTTCTPFLLSAAAGAASYSLAAPISHLLEENPTSALLSLVLRVGLPTAGGALAALGGDGTLFAVGIAGGVASAVAIDWFLLSKRVSGSGSPKSDVVPTVSPTPGGFSLGAGGRF